MNLTKSIAEYLTMHSLNNYITYPKQIKCAVNNRVPGEGHQVQYIQIKEIIK